jgi:hypothetical protein
MGTLTKIIAIASLTILATACDETPAPPQTVFSAQIDKSSFQGRWPLIPAAGVLACDTSKGAGAVTFTPQGSATTYAINGPALDWAKTTGWPDSKVIWNGENWGDFIDTGLKMCNDRSGTPPPAPTAAPLSETDIRGLYSPISFWDRTFTPATISNCVAQGTELTPAGDPSTSLNVTHAWHLPGGVLACAPNPNSQNNGPNGRMTLVDLYFTDPGADIHTALDATLSVLPTDATHISTFHGANTAESQHPNGGCQIETYSSNALAAARNRYDPTGASMQDPHKVSVQLSTGQPLPGGYNDQPFNPASVHDATIIYGDTPPTGSGDAVTC